MTFNPDQLSYQNEAALLLKREFLIPFDEEDVIKKFKEPVETSDPDALVSQRMFVTYEQVYGTYTYRILHVVDDSRQMEEFIFELGKDPKEKPLTELVLRNAVSKVLGTGYDIKHRIAQTSGEGISGSSFLKKAEDYMKILKKHGLAECNFFFARSMQPNVTRWFIKNGYNYANPHDEAVERSFTEENSETIYFDFLDHISERDPAVVKKDAFNNPEFTKYLHTDKEGRKIWSLPFDEANKFMEKYFPYVTLGKKLE